MNNFLENLDLFGRPRLVPGNKLYEIAISECEVNPRYEEINFSRQPQRKKTSTISDSNLTRIEKDFLRKKVK